MAPNAAAIMASGERGKFRYSQLRLRVTLPKEGTAGWGVAGGEWRKA